MSSAEECPRGGIADDVMISTEDTPYDVRLMCIHMYILSIFITTKTHESES